MCTAFAKIGGDVIYGFNLDIDPNVWNYSLSMNRKWFSVGITVGKTTYLTHGVNREGHFSNVPYMNGTVLPVPRGMRRERIDLLTDRYIRGKYSYEDVLEILRTKAVVSPPAATMHSLIGDGKERLVIVEPGYGIEHVPGREAVIANFPVLGNLTDYSNPYYGKDRFDLVRETIGQGGDTFSVNDALSLLERVRQGGRWGTRISFVYSRNENAVFYFLNGDISNTEVHRFE